MIGDEGGDEGVVFADQELALAGCVAIGFLLARRHAIVARWFAALVSVVTARAVSGRGHEVARAGVSLLGITHALLGAAVLLEARRIISPLAAIQIVVIAYLLVRLARLGTEADVAHSRMPPAAKENG